MISLILTVGIFDPKEKRFSDFHDEYDLESSDNLFSLLDGANDSDYAELSIASSYFTGESVLSKFKKIIIKINGKKKIRWVVTE